MRVCVTPTRRPRRSSDGILLLLLLKYRPRHVYRQQVTSTEASVTQHTRADIPHNMRPRQTPAGPRPHNMSRRVAHHANSRPAQLPQPAKTMDHRAGSRRLVPHSDHGHKAPRGLPPAELTIAHPLGSQHVQIEAYDDLSNRHPAPPRHTIRIQLSSLTLYVTHVHLPRTHHAPTTREPYGPLTGRAAGRAARQWGWSANLLRFKCDAQRKA